MSEAVGLLVRRLSRPSVSEAVGQLVRRLELMRRARRKSVAVVFHLHTFGYNDRRAFADAAAVIFPSVYSRRYHARTLGLDGPVISDPIPLDRVVAENPEPKYVTFINPQPAKGLTAFARIAMELNQRRPDIPFLVVESRGTSESLAQLPVDLSGLKSQGNVLAPTDRSLRQGGRRFVGRGRRPTRSRARRCSTQFRTDAASEPDS